MLMLSVEVWLVVSTLVFIAFSFLSEDCFLLVRG